MEYSWILLCSMFVFLMQAGFLCLESGKIRSKNSINVAAKNITDFIVSTIIFWLFGFAIMFGDSINGLFGTSLFGFGANSSPFQISFFIFQLMFCGTAATILSGAVAERMSFRGYIFATVLLTSVLYPVTGHWAWANFFQPDNSGWLQSLGFIDFAGSTIVHSVGGWVALAAVLIIGPRLGRFNSEFPFPGGSNLPLSVLGTLLLWLGWFGFNGGSTFKFNDQVPLILMNTSIAAAWGGLSASLLYYYFNRYIDVTFILNGVIGGLVGITAGCHAVSPQSAAIIGAVAGAIVVFGVRGLDKLKIDDALGVVPAHLFAGIWGTLAVALFGDLTALGTELSRVELLGVQMLGIASIGAYTFTLSYLILTLINRFYPLRVSAEKEHQGMNISEHRASTELIDLLTNMHRQETQGHFSDPVPVEPFTEVGQIATQYNRVIQRVNDEIGERDQAIQKFRSSEKRKGAILNSAMDSILTISAKGNIIEFNPTAERTFGFLKKQVVGKSFIQLFVLPKDQDRFSNSLAQHFSSPEGLVINRRNTITLLRDEDNQFPVEITITEANFDRNSRQEYTLHVRDISREVKLQDNLKQLAYSDPLTGLYNRTFLLETLTRAIQFNADAPNSVAVFFMDLDKFKKINDTLGHKAGDELLNEVAKRLVAATRASDTIARWGGDEFVVMIHGADIAGIIQPKAKEFLNVMRQPMFLAGREIKIPTSIGVAVNFETSITAEQLIQHADIAMYEAKERGRDNYQIFDPTMANKVTQQFNFEQEIRDGLKQSDQFFMVYQPKLDIQQEVTGLEALIRWQHPTEGFIMPSDFIPLAEESDIILRLGEKVIELTIAQLLDWKNQNLKLVPISINISGKHLVSGDLVSFMAKQLNQSGIPGELLEIEITEGVLMTDIEQCIAVMSELKALNIQLSIDDFGTGYSSLNYLKRLPIDVLKIDRSFVDECASSIEDGQIVTTIINLAKNLDLKTVAEGVETLDQVNFLASHGCNMFQGYYFYKPLSVDDVHPLIAKPIKGAGSMPETNQ